MRNEWMEIFSQEGYRFCKVKPEETGVFYKYYEEGFHLVMFIDGTNGYLPTSSASSCRTGASIWQGPHQVAEKSRTATPCALAWERSLLLILVTIKRFPPLIMTVKQRVPLLFAGHGYGVSTP